MCSPLLQLKNCCSADKKFEDKLKNVNFLGTTIVNFRHPCIGKVESLMPMMRPCCGDEIVVKAKKKKVKRRDNFKTR